MILLQTAYLVWFAATWIPAQTSGWLLVARCAVSVAAISVWLNYETGLTTIGHICFLIDFASTFGALAYNDPRLASGGKS